MVEPTSDSIRRDLPTLETEYGTITLTDPEFPKESTSQLFQIILNHLYLFNPVLPPEGIIGKKFKIVPLKDAEFKKHYPRPIPDKYFEFFNQCLDELLSLDFIESYNKDEAIAISPPLIVANKNKLRMCIDYKDVNSKIESLIFGLPRVQDAIKFAKGKKWFIKLDMTKGFHQLLLDEESLNYLCFSTPHRGVFRWKRLPFGPKNGPSFFR